MSYQPLIVVSGSSTDPIVWQDPPEDAPFPHLERMNHPQLGLPVQVWIRKDPHGRVIGGQARWMENGDKQDRQFRWGAVNGKQGWLLKAGPKPWPLFGLHELHDRPTAPVLIVEGPKTREAAAQIFPGWVVVSACGASAATSFDWRPLRHRKVLIWPDADVPGLKYAHTVCGILGILADSNVIHVPLQGMQGWDLADPVPEGWSIEDMLQTATLAVVRDVAVEVGDLDDDEIDREDLERRQELYLPEEFWTARPGLEAIRDWCRWRRFPVDSTFAAALTRVAAMLSPSNMLETGLGDPVPPILFAMIVADSGGGKSIASRGAVSLVPRVQGIAMLDGATPGSGEGIEGAYCRKCNDGPDWEQVRHNAWFSVDEGEVIQQIRRRNGATLGAKLRQLWTGSPLVTQLAGSVREASHYTAGLVFSMQFSVLIEMLSDAEASLGTPGRFLWCHAGDPHLGGEVKPISTPRMWWPVPGLIEMDPRVKKEIDDSYCRRMRGEEKVESIDAHRNYVKARVAALLCVIDQRAFVTPDDWFLAEVVMATSDRVRAYCLEETEVHKSELMQDDISRQLVKARASKAAQVSSFDPEMDRAIIISKRCHRLWSESRPFRKRDAQRALKGDGQYTAIALTFAESMGWIEKRGEFWRPGQVPIGKMKEDER